jgi:hypothetical protein
LVFGDVNRKLMDLVEEHLPVPRWQGLRIVASDTAAVRLTTMKEGVRSIVTGVAFGLYLPGIEMFLHFALQHGACDERQMLFEVIERLQVDDLLVLDRGFPCRWLAAALTARGIPFCIRCDISRGFRVVREFMRSGQSEQLVSLRAPNARDAQDYECPATPTTVRLVRVTTPNGRQHVVMTSLLDAVAFPAAVFGCLADKIKPRFYDAATPHSREAYGNALLRPRFAGRQSRFRRIDLRQRRRPLPAGTRCLARPR